MTLVEKIKSSLSRVNLDDLYNDFLGLEKNQQILVVSGIGLVLLLLLFLPINCVSSKINEKEDRYHRYAKMASEFYAIQEEYSRLKKSFDQVKNQASRLGTDPLKRVLYDLTDGIGIERSKIEPKTMSPVVGELFTEIGKEVTIENVRFDQVITLLGELVNFKDLPIHIKSLQIKADKNNKQLMNKVKFTITTMRPSR